MKTLVHIKARNAGSITTPGSEAAIQRGCTCPPDDNHNGVGIHPTDKYAEFWIDVDCELHRKAYEKGTIK